MKTNRKVSLFAIMRSFLKIGFIGFGGGSALIPITQQEIVDSKGYLPEKDYLHHTVIANITPGALPVKLGATCGYQMGGAVGSVACAYAVMLPGVFLTVLIMALFDMLGSGMVHYIQYASVGITAFIIFLLTSYILKTVRQGERKKNLMLCAAAFLVTGGKEIISLIAMITGVEARTPFLDISTIDLMIVTFFLILLSGMAKARFSLSFGIVLAAAYVVVSGKWGSSILPWAIRYVLISAMVILILSLFFRNREKKQANTGLKITKGTLKSLALYLIIAIIPALAALIIMDAAVLEFIGQAAISTVTSFGGGEAYISVADGLFVQGGYIAADVFYTRLVPVANALPGPILVKIAAGIGYVFGSMSGSVNGWLLAAVSAAVSTGLCSGLAILIFNVYDNVKESVLVAGLKLYMLPVICGMLLSTSCSMLYEGMKTLGESGVSGGSALVLLIAWVIVLFIITRKKHVSDLLLLLASAVLSVGALSVLN